MCSFSEREGVYSLLCSFLRLRVYMCSFLCSFFEREGVCYFLCSCLRLRVCDGLCVRV